MRAIFSAALAAFACISTAVCAKTMPDTAAKAAEKEETLQAHHHGEWEGEDGVRPEQCYGIALSDASDFGPYQAGALIGLLKH